MILEDDLSRLSAISFSYNIPTCPGTHKSWIRRLDWLREYKYDLIWKTRGESLELNGLDVRDCKQDIESEAIK